MLLLACFLTFVLYTATSYLLLRNPHLLHPPPKTKRRTCFQPPLHISHRGGAGEASENTLDAFHNAVRVGTDMLELDCHLTKDGRAVVSHDTNLERVTGEKCCIHETNYADLPPLLPSLELSFHEGNIFTAKPTESRRIPLVEDLFKAFPQTPINIDMVDGDDRLIAEVDRLIQEYKRERLTVWGSCTASVVAKLHQANPSIPRFFPFETTLRVIASYWIGLLPFLRLEEDYFEIPDIHSVSNKTMRSFLGIDGLILKLMMMLWELVGRELHENGFESPHNYTYDKQETIFWVCNSTQQFDRAFELGACGVMTDYPTKLKAYLEEKSNSSSSLTHAEGGDLSRHTSNDDGKKRAQMLHSDNKQRRFIRLFTTKIDSFLSGPAELDDAWL